MSILEAVGLAIVVDRLHVTQKVVDSLVQFPHRDIPRFVSVGVFTVR